MENLYALWTYDEILIAVPPKQHTPVARSKALLTGRDVKAEWTANCGQAAGSSGSTIRLDLLRMRCPFGGNDRPVRVVLWRDDGRGACAPAMAGRPASAGEDKEVS